MFWYIAGTKDLVHSKTVWIHSSKKEASVLPCFLKEKIDVFQNTLIWRIHNRGSDLPYDLKGQDVVAPKQCDLSFLRNRNCD